MNIDEETQKKIQELQSLEQTLQNLMMQKQSFQMELNESENAEKEISETNEDVFKLVGNIMIKADKEKIKSDLKKKKELLALRLKSIDSQESEVFKKFEDLKKQVMEKIK